MFYLYVYIAHHVHCGIVFNQKLGIFMLWLAHFNLNGHLDILSFSFFREEYINATYSSPTV